MSPVTDLIVTLSTQFPELSFEYCFSKEGMMFAANIAIKNGEWLNEEYLDEDDMMIERYLENPRDVTDYPIYFSGYADIFKKDAITKWLKQFVSQKKNKQYGKPNN
jgi:hypothetical protein